MNKLNRKEFKYYKYKQFPREKLKKNNKVRVQIIELLLLFYATFNYYIL